MMSPFQRLHNSVLNMIQFSVPGLMGTHVECGSISLLALLVHLHISPWEWQRREQPDVIIHRPDYTRPHSAPIIKAYFAGRETCCIYNMDGHVIYMLTWTENCLHCVPWDGISAPTFSRGETSIGWGTRELLSHQINNTLVVKVSRLHYGPFLNPCDVILLHYRYTDRLMGKCVRYDVA